MKQFLLLKDEEGASADEFFQAMERFAIYNNVKCDIKHVKQVEMKDLILADIVFCIRGDTPYMLHLLEIVKRMKKTIVYFLDDALKDIPNDSFRYPNRKKWHVECVKYSDVLLTTNPLIANDYREYITSKRTAIINSSVEGIVSIKKHEEKIKIVYAASEWHISNYNRMIAPIIHKLLDNNKRNLEVYFVGFKPNKIEDEHIHYVPKMNLIDYQSYMKNAGFDIGLAPLEHSHFSERKYFNKFIEYTRYGICGIYSDTYPYRFVVKHRKNGILVPDDPQAWLKSIQELIDDSSLRNSCVNKAQEYIKSEHSDAVIFEKLKTDIPELMYSSACESQDDIIKNFKLNINKFFKYFPFVVKEKLYMVKFSIRKEGLNKTFHRICEKL